MPSGAAQQYGVEGGTEEDSVYGSVSGTHRRVWPRASRLRTARADPRHEGVQGRQQAVRGFGLEGGGREIRRDDQTRPGQYAADLFGGTRLRLLLPGELVRQPLSAGEAR